MDKFDISFGKEDARHSVKDLIALISLFSLSKCH